jgi:ribose transport system ATP-binding protein/rhamnose transport system ATP-binding protein
LSVEDNIWLGSLRVPFLHKRPELRRRAAETLALLGAGHLKLDAPVATLSMGERQLVEIARLLTRDARVLILDEPTATLTDVEIERIFAALLAVKREGRSVLYITHRLAEVYAICDRVSVLRNGELVATTSLSGLDRAALIELMLGRPSGEMYPEEARARGAPALVVEGLSLPGIVDDFAMTVRRGEILCIAGQVGSGAAEIIAALAGLVHDANGRVTVNGRPLKLGSPSRAAQRGIMFVSGDRAAEGVFRRLSVLHNLVATRLHDHSLFGFLRGGALRAAAARLAKRVDIDRRRLRARAEELSGGNQQKIAFGRMIERQANGVLLMNEPTRGIDVGARAEIYRLMRSFCEEGYALVMASSDLEEIVGVGDVIITLYRGRQVGHYRRNEATMHRIVADITQPADSTS